MPLTKEDRLRLEDKAHDLRMLCVDTVVWAGSGHIGGSMSAMDIMTILYHKYMRIDAKKPAMPDRDRFILSKGHVGVGYAPVLADLGYFDKELLKEYNHTNSPLGMHLDSRKVTGVEASTGSLGHGLAIGLGMALGARLKGESWKTYVLLGDGECDEGAVWESAMAASHFKATNLVTIVDRNKCMIDGPTEDVMALEPFADKWRAFGFDVIEADGHDFDSLSAAFDAANAAKDKPVVIIADTIKGCGIDFISGDYKWHYGGFDADKTTKAKESLARFRDGRKAGAGRTAEGVTK